jgi:hypothetical protein
MTDREIPESWEEVARTGIDMTRLSDFPPGFRRTVYRVEASVVDGQLKVARQRHHEFFCDEPPAIGGQDRYPQPLAYFAAGLGF